MEKQNHKGVNDYDYDNGYGKLKDMQRWCGNQKFHDDVDKKLADIRKKREEKNKKNSDFSNGKSRWCGKKPDSIKMNESQLRKMVSKIIKESLEELGGEDDFQPNGYKGMNNYGGNEIQVNRNGDSARIRFQDGEVTDWLEIEFDEEGVAYVTTPYGEQEKLSDYMRY